MTLKEFTDTYPNTSEAAKFLLDMFPQLSDAELADVRLSASECLAAMLSYYQTKSLSTVQEILKNVSNGTI